MKDDRKNKENRNSFNMKRPDTNPMLAPSKVDLILLPPFFYLDKSEIYSQYIPNQVVYEHADDDDFLKVRFQVTELPANYLNTQELDRAKTYSEEHSGQEEKRNRQDRRGGELQEQEGRDGE
jgi:hypothetical protein